MENYVYCPKCGSRVPTDQNYCPECGAKMRSLTQEIPVSFPDDPTTLQMQNADNADKHENTLSLPSFATTTANVIEAVDDMENTEEIPTMDESYFSGEFPAQKEEAEDDSSDSMSNRTRLILVIFLAIITGILLFAINRLLHRAPAPVEPTPTPVVETPTPTPEVIEETPEPEVIIGKATMLMNGVNIRKGPTTSAESVGKTTAGTVYDVYERVEAEGYAWYRVGEDMWVANNGEFLTFEAAPQEQPVQEETTEESGNNG